MVAAPLLALPLALGAEPPAPGAGVGAILGSLIAPLWESRRGMGRTLVLSQVLTGLARLLLLLAPGSYAWILTVLALSEIVLGIARAGFNVCQLSLRQSAVPASLQGRVNASFSFLLWGATPVGGLLGGWLGSAMGLRPCLLVAGIGVLASTAWLLPFLSSEPQLVTEEPDAP